jgi:hypothetical protein
MYNKSRYEGYLQRLLDTVAKQTPGCLETQQRLYGGKMTSKEVGKREVVVCVACFECVCVVFRSRFVGRRPLLYCSCNPPIKAPARIPTPSSTTHTCTQTQALASFLLRHQQVTMAYMRDTKRKLEAAAPGKRVIPHFLHYLHLEWDETAETLKVRAACPCD